MTETNAADDALEPGRIQVSGTGRVAIDPDIAEVRLGVSVARPTVAAARADGSTTMTAILAAIDAAGVTRRDVRTTLLSVQPRYDYRDNRAPALTGYELANTVEVTVRDLSRLAGVIDGALEAGATSLDGLEFRVDDPAPAEREARIRAMASARTRADILAEAAGLTILGVRDVLEGPAMGPPMPRMKAARMSLADADAATPVEAGTTEVVVTVTVSYLAR